MTNAQIAQILEEIADFLEIEGENTFRVRSYRRAAETVAGLADEVADIFTEEGTQGLQNLSGIGKGIAQKLAELLETGEMTYHRELIEKYPPGMLEMLRIPGLGPRTAALIYHELEISSVDELEEAAEAHRLRDLPGLGAKSEEKILHNIQVYRQGTRRALLGDILPIAERLIAMLRSNPAVLKAEMAGSARRRKATVGDLDLLATSEEPAVVCDAFAQSEELAEVTMAGETKVSGRLPGGRQVDLRVVEPGSYGAALQYFTGSADHNVALRERAQKMDLTINEYGIFEEKEGEKGKKVAGETEAGIYEAVGLAWIPPELREARGEIEAAESGQLPNLITLADIRSDLHVHTTGSDGHNTLEQMAEACRQRGYEYIGITDHSPVLNVAGGLTAEEIKQQRQQIDELNKQYEDEGINFRVLAGLEADILNAGQVDVPEEVFDLLDFVLGSVHQGFSPDADKMTQRIIEALESGKVDTLGHPTGRLLLQREAYGIHLDDVIEAAGELAVAVEINAYPQRLDLDDIHARFAQHNGTLLSINTDAHAVSQLDFMRYGIATARRGWIEAPSVINTWPLEELQNWLQRRREDYS